MVRSIRQGRGRWHAVVGLVFILALAFELFELHALGTVESRLTDSFMRHHAADFKADPNIVVVDIDDQSMLAMQEIAGLWAWPREVHADLIDALAEFAPRAIVFDIAFSEHDARHAKSDARLSDSLKAFGTHAYLAATVIDDQHGVQTPLRELSVPFGVTHSGSPLAAATMLLPHAIDASIWRLGLDNSVVDGDGVQRRYRLYKTAQDWQLPSLPARVASDFGAGLPNGDSFLMSWPETGHARYSYGVLFKMLTEQRPLMNDLQVHQLDEALRGKIILIGSSATSSFDHHLTPLEGAYPGIDVLATALDNLINEHYIRRVATIWPMLFGVGLITMLVLAFSRRINPLHVGIGLTLITAASLMVADQAIVQLWMLPLATPLIFAWVWFLTAAITGFLQERRTREQAVSLFQRFLNPEVVRKIVDHGETVESLSGRAVEISVLFSDIRGFTTLSEKHPPQKVVDLLNRYFDRQVEVVFRHGGTLDKFIGDCIMAFWGAPIDDPEHAKRAVAAALEMQETVLEFQRELLAENSDLAEIDVGIGVHSGPAVVGFIGARRKLDYTAIGDTVNLASRIEGLTKGVARVLVSQETMIACGALDDIEFESRGAFAVKGRTAEVELYEPKRKNA